MAMAGTREWPSNKRMGDVDLTRDNGFGVAVHGRSVAGWLWAGRGWRDSVASLLRIARSGRSRLLLLTHTLGQAVLLQLVLDAAHCALDRSRGCSLGRTAALAVASLDARTALLLSDRYASTACVPCWNMHPHAS
jgi:hypothetical protein